MIYLNPGVNTITLTLYEKSSQSSPYYTFQIIRKGTFDTTIFYNNDNSPVPYYWNSFTVSVQNYEGLTAGIINVSSGEYTYNVYEMPEPYLLTLTASYGLVETGILIVNGTYSSNQSYIGTDDDTIVYYKNM